MNSLAEHFTNSAQKESTSSLHSAQITDSVIRPLQPRKCFKVTPWSRVEKQKELEKAEKADTEPLWKRNKSVIQEDDEDKENVQPNLSSSIELSFAPLCLITPAKKPEVTKSVHFATPLSNCKPIECKNSQRTLDFQYITPKQPIQPKIQCSVDMKKYLRTPITDFCSGKLDSDCNTASFRHAIQKIKVNNVHYVVLSELGKGGSSQVFHCYNSVSQERRAIKKVSLDNQFSAESLINEVKVLQKLQNCNRIVKMFDYEIIKEVKLLYVVLEVGGADFSKILKQSAQQTSHMPLHKLIYYWMEMLYAVQQIHSNNIIHADLKPANFLEIDGYLKLIDFGIASCIPNDFTSVLKTVPEGSCNYISPEALQSESVPTNKDKPKYKISFKSDVWSLGCILYQMVYGRTPFQHITQMYIRMAAITNPDHEIEYPKLDWVPQRIFVTIKKCLQNKVKLRPSVDDLVSEYENSLQHL